MHSESIIEILKDAEPHGMDDANRTKDVTSLQHVRVIASDRRSHDSSLAVL
jgi:hypothetical protein